jgi:P4 family phage/plasmid primase-like protien
MDAIFTRNQQGVLWSDSNSAIDSISTGIRHFIKFLKTKKSYYYWNNNYYEECSKDQIIAVSYEVLKWCAEKINSSSILRTSMARAKTICEIIAGYTEIDPLRLNNYDNYIPFKNGDYNIRERQLEDKTYERLFTYCIEVEYKDEIEDPELFLVFVQRLIPDEERRNLFLSFLASCMTTRVDGRQKAIMLVGPHNSGKSTLTDTIIPLFGNGMVATAQLHSIFSDAYGTAGLKGKIINVGSDIGTGDLKYDGGLKRLLTDQHVDIRPMHNERMTIKNITKHLYTCNYLPLISFDGFGDDFYKRWFVIPTCTSIPIDQQIPRLSDHLVLEKEKIFNWLIKNSLHDVENLYRKDVIEENKILWMKHGISSFRFIEELYNFDPRVRLASERSATTYAKYKEFCLDKKYPLATFDKFGKEIAKLGIHSEVLWNEQERRSERHYIGLIVKGLELEEEQLVEEEDDDFFEEEEVEERERTEN